ncbi:MAG: SMC-Scp complex subunit ScpB [Pseudomonadota bacterium]
MTEPEPETLENAPEAIRKAVQQLSFAYSRSERAVTTGITEAMAEGMRRAEAVLFAAGEPLSAEQVTAILPQGLEAGDVLMALQSEYRGRGVELTEVAGKWRFQSAADLDFLFVEERHVQKKLSQASLETLAIIAYGQPVTRAEIEAVRGVAVSKGTIDTLMETGWIKIKGRRKTPGRPVTYGTIDAFLEHFGLESLAVLPGKADLEAEGLLADVVPDDFQAPGEEGLEDDQPEHDGELDENPDSEDPGFVTDYLSTGTDAD